jgi:hypothetical protein
MEMPAPPPAAPAAAMGIIIIATMQATTPAIANFIPFT